MVIIRVMGGLGNQMFQYALYKSFETRGVDARLDLTWYSDVDTKDNKRPFQLDAFNVQYLECSIWEKLRLANLSGYWGRKCQRVIGKKTTHIYEQEPYYYQPFILSLNNAYLDGYWQSEKYFCEIKDIIRSDFSICRGLDRTLPDYTKKIKKCVNAVAVHIRRGDYLKNYRYYGGICDETYYMRAIQLVKSKVEFPVFFVFSDDLRWAKSFLGDRNDIVYIEEDTQTPAYIDLMLMSMCKHQIIANSSYSWWGAWLNDYGQKMVIAPSVWVNIDNTPDVWCEGWIRL